MPFGDRFWVTNRYQKLILDVARIEAGEQVVFMYGNTALAERAAERATYGKQSDVKGGRRCHHDMTATLASGKDGVKRIQWAHWCEGGVAGGVGFGREMARDLQG